MPHWVLCLVSDENPITVMEGSACNRTNKHGRKSDFTVITLSIGSDRPLETV